MAKKNAAFVFAARLSEEIHLKFRKIDKVDHLIIVNAYGSLYGKHFGYKNQNEECFRVPLELVQKHLRFDFDPADLQGSTRREREKYIRLMGILLDVVDTEKEEFNLEEQLRRSLGAAGRLEAGTLPEAVAA